MHLVPETHCTKDPSIIIEIYSQLRWNNRNKLLVMSHKHSCHAMSKILKCCNEQGIYLQQIILTSDLNFDLKFDSEMGTKSDVE